MNSRPDFSMIVGYGSDMGNAEDAAMSFAEAFEETTGRPAEAVELNQVDITELQSATHLVVVTSTWGDGEFPDNANLFWEALSADAADRLEHLSFAVLALGDTGYDLFCNAGRLLDERLEQLGATRLAERVDIDGSYAKPASAWTTDVVKLLAAEHNPAAAGVVVTSRAAHPVDEAPSTNPDRDHPFEARVVVNRLLTAPGSDKEVRHYELDLTGSGIAYAAGDSLAVHPTNDPALVDAMLAEFGLGPDHTVPGHDEPLGALLTRRLEIRTPSRALRELTASRTHDEHAAAALNGNVGAAQGSWLYGRDVLDLIRLGSLTADEVIDMLRPLQYRDYSIASSPLVSPDHVHLTVATVRYGLADRHYGGVATTFLADRADTVRVHLRPTHSFRLPGPDVPVIMIGPGTGVAPFRAFLQERRAAGAKGRSWLFFGNRRRASDFLYRDEFEDYLRSGVLTRLDLAFSRDGAADAANRYVQQRMWEHSTELFSWLEEGAQLYVCGDAERMAKDVDAALHAIVASAGNMDTAAAHAYVNQLIKTHRYLRDVY
ncbi:diflavin oxidoreductase [Mycolicibacter heraklionensis]|uniref:assimilatory sulfite reductase (NADPH) n=1 Tax=Mycolicibacter heraklionensis TaxID=512402 RepID=A0AA91EV29_9MYCO|nr:sulfite reductase flavoprotein subunit alpha [Mycolicibacter heraklionensis]OBK85763.1 sulfite reductase subunit alpha [Mycolicibacter heraklionensis]